MNDNMNLLVISREFPPYVVGGISHHMYNLYSRLAQRGHNIYIIAGKTISKSDGNLVEIDNLDVEWVNLPTLQLNHVTFPLIVKKNYQNLIFAILT